MKRRQLLKKFEIFINNFRFNMEMMYSSFNESHESYEENVFGLKKLIIRSRIKILKQLQNASFRTFAVDNELTFSTNNYKKEPKDRLYFHQLDGFNLLSYNVHVLLPPSYNFLYSTFDWKIKQLVEGGFFVYWIERHLNHPSLRILEPDPDDDKIVLTLDHLSVGFIICLGMLLVALVAMIAELVRFHLANYLRGFLFQMILRKHQKLRHNP